MYRVHITEEKVRYPSDGKGEPVTEWVTTHDVTVTNIKTLVLMLHASAEALDDNRR